MDADASGGGKRREGGTAGGDRFEEKFSTKDVFRLGSKVGESDGEILICRLLKDVAVEGVMRGIRDKLDVVGGRGGRLELEGSGADAGAATEGDIGKDVERAGIGGCVRIMDG